jgi:hypothetical protein
VGGWRRAAGPVGGPWWGVPGGPWGSGKTTTIWGSLGQQRTARAPRPSPAAEPRGVQRTAPLPSSRVPGRAALRAPLPTRPLPHPTRPLPPTPPTPLPLQTIGVDSWVVVPIASAYRQGHKLEGTRLTVVKVGRWSRRSRSAQRPPRPALAPAPGQARSICMAPGPPSRITLAARAPARPPSCPPGAQPARRVRVLHPHARHAAALGGLRPRAGPGLGGAGGAAGAGAPGGVPLPLAPGGAHVCGGGGQGAGCRGVRPPGPGLAQALGHPPARSCPAGAAWA